MKIYISIIATAILLFTSCINDFEPDMPLMVPGDEIRIELITKDNTHLSRSAATNDEKAIHNAFVYVFNSLGSKVYAGIHDDLTGSGTTDTATIKITKYNVDPNGMTVAVVTNVGEQNQVSEISTDDLFAVPSLDALRMLRVEKDDNLSINSMLERGDMFVMYGEAELEAAGTTTTVTVERIDAKVKFNITVGTPDDSKNISNLRFYPSQWRVCKVPLVSFLFNTAKTETDAKDDEYADTPQWYNFEEITNDNVATSYITAGDDNKATFEFYVPENIKSADIGSDEYNKRDMRNPDGSFTNAPKNSTYVEFAGVIEYNKTDSYGNILESIMANAQFTVHLGGLDKDGTTYSKNWNNFSSYGNTHYTYNIKILGAEDILANVDGEANSGISGEHTVTEFKKSVDAYNNVFNLELERGELGDDIKWHIKTPFSDGFSDDTNPPKDYHWIHFMFRDDIGDNLMTYPGNTEVYSDVVTEENVAAFYSKYTANIIAGTDKMLNVDQLTKVLAYARDRELEGEESPIFRNDNLEDGGTGDVAHFTIFVDDYYYEEDPNADGSSDNIMLWQKFANAQTRLLNITSQYDKSTDEQSISMTSMYNITQNSIQTMYNTAPLDAGETEYTAFGSQFYPLSKPGSLDEEANFTPSGSGVGKLIGTNSNGLPTTDNDEFNGRKNYIELLRNLNSGSITGALPSWDKYIDPATWTLRSNYDYPMFRPLLMNRDTNGNGEIDQEEIQWYLASLSQLIDLWVGEDSFNNVSKLYLHNDWSTDHQNQQHYISSTIKDGGTWVLWSAEGAAIGPYSDYDVINNATKLYYRTVRNLGIPRTSDDAPDRIGHRRKEDGHTYIIMNRLGALSIRPSLTTGKQASHTERSETNRPYKKFEINTAVYDNGNTYRFDVAQNLNDLGEWRLPNQRELILMMSIPSEFGNDTDTFSLNNTTAMSATKFGWNTAASNRPGFFKSADNRLSLFSYNDDVSNEAQIYLVKDVAN